MVEFMITYTSKSEGISIGVIGDSYMECLLSLCDEFGDGVMPLYEATRNELEETAKAVADSYRDKIEEMTKKHLVEASNAITVSEVKEPSGIDEDSSTKDVGETSDADEDGTATQREISAFKKAAQSIAEIDQDAPSSPECSICSAPITADEATASRIMHGQPRCKDCRP